MFSFADELKWYEPGLETLEDSMSGDEQKDLIELMQTLLKVRPDNAGAERKEEQEPEGTQLSIEDALKIPTEAEA